MTCNQQRTIRAYIHNESALSALVIVSCPNSTHKLFYSACLDVALFFTNPQRHHDPLLFRLSLITQLILSLVFSICSSPEGRESGSYQADAL